MGLDQIDILVPYFKITLGGILIYMMYMVGFLNHSNTKVLSNAAALRVKVLFPCLMRGCGGNSRVGKLTIYLCQNVYFQVL